MKGFNAVSRGLVLILGLLLISGCDAIQDVIISEPPSGTDAEPLRVTMVYPSDCVAIPRRTVLLSISV